jgi:glyoxylase-like metal-dependent hydrolase (beta-lactamase superfamily II)
MKFSNLIKSVSLATILTVSACARGLVDRDQQVLSVKSFSADLSGFAVNSHLIMGKKDAILVDSQFTRSQAKKVVDMIKKSERNLKMVYITHGHPDHYLGLEVILTHFPGVKIMAKEGVIETIKESAQGKIDYWKPIYKEDLADRYQVPRLIEGDEIYLEGEVIKIVEMGRGESAHDTALYIPSLKALISGDTTYGKVHFWLVEEGAQEVLQNLNDLLNFEIETVYPGHGESGTKSLIIENIDYIKDFINATNENRNVEEAKKVMLAKYPKYLLPIILDLSLKAMINK